MQAVSLEERRDSSTSVGERAIKRLRVGEEHGGEHEVPTELCVRHPSLYLEDGNVILRCENTLFKFYIGILSRKSEVFGGMFQLAPIQPANSEKTVEGLPVVRLHDSPEDFAYLLSALLDYESLFLQRCMQYQRFAALLRLSVKYEMAGVHKILVHRVQRYYPVEMSDYECVMEEHGTAAAAAFTSFPHPNQILKLFWECEIRQCLPIAFYEATVRGVNSLTSPKPKVFLPRQISTPALKALAAFNNGYREHVGSVLYSFCSDCRCKNLLAIEQWLHPVRGDLSLFPLRDVGVKPGVSGLLCESCVGEMVDAYSAWRLSIWADLPGTFGLPGWRELSKLVVLK